MNLKIGDKVYTDTHAVYQNTQESLSRLSGIIINIEDKYDIHVKLDNKPNYDLVGFSESELSLEPITTYKNENI